MSEEMKQAVQPEEIAVPTPEETGETAGEGEGETVAESATATDETQDEEKPKKMGGFQKRIAKLSAQREAAMAEVEYWRQRALDSKPKVETEDAAKPKADDYKTVDEYLDARDAWVEERAAKRALKEYESKAKTDTAKTEAEKTQEAWRERETAFVESHEDYDEAADEALGVLKQHEKSPSANAVGQAIMEHDSGPELLYHLGKNPEEAAKLAKMKPLAALIELGKIAASLAKPKAEAKPQQPKAPKPVTPVGKPSGTKALDINDPSIPFKEYCKLRDAAKGK